MIACHGLGGGGGFLGLGAGLSFLVMRGFKAFSNKGFSFIFEKNAETLEDAFPVLCEAAGAAGVAG